MATKDSPTVIEPITSTNPLPTIPKLSPDPSSSSDSFGSSRPSSQTSSTTSRSGSPSPIPKSVPASESHESIELPALSSDPSLPENTSANQVQRQDDPSRSVPSTPTVSPGTNHGASGLSYLGYLIPRRHWFSNTLGSLNFGLTLIGMLIFGKIAVWTARNDAMTTCANIISAGKKYGQNCQDIVSKDKWDIRPLPYNFWKRSWSMTLGAGSRLNMDGMMKRSNPPAAELGSDAVSLSISNFSSIAIVLASTVVVGCLSLIVFRRYWRTEEIFTSPVRSDWQFTRHHEGGPETVSGEGYRMIVRNPENDHPLRQLGDRIRNSQPNAVENPTGEPTWQTHNTSEETLVGPWKNTKWGTSKVSLTNDDSDEKHENLIELETEGPNKTFFDPETGEFIHLRPWKSTGDEEVHGLKPDGKGSIKRAFAQMTLGATGWAGGKNIDDQLAEELQANSKGGGEELGEPKAGDCTTGNTTNEAPSGKPVVDPIAAPDNEENDDVDPKVSAFLLRKPWYARTAMNSDEDAEAEANGEGAGAAGWLHSASLSDHENEETASWVSQTDLDGGILSGPMVTWVPVLQSPSLLSTQTPDWETRAMDSSQLPYPDRESFKVGSVNVDAVVAELARINEDEDESGDIDTTLAKLEGQYAKSEGDFYNKESATKQNTEEAWQAVLAKTNNDKQYWLRPKKKEAAGLDSGRNGRKGSCFDGENITSPSPSARQPEQAAVQHAIGTQQHKTEHDEAELRPQSKQHKRQKFRPIRRLTETQGPKTTTNSSTGESHWHQDCSLIWRESGQLDSEMSPEYLQRAFEDPRPTPTIPRRPVDADLTST